MAAVTTQAKYLKFYREGKTFEEAQYRCIEEGGNLLMDDEGEEWHETIASHLERILNGINLRDFAVWMGAYKQDGIWNWVDGKEMYYFLLGFPF